jgi:hypothetical protein
MTARNADRHRDVSLGDRAVPDPWLPRPCRTKVQPAARSKFPQRGRLGLAQCSDLRMIVRQEVERLLKDY